MSAALEVIKAIEANGGRVTVEGDRLVIVPRQAGIPLLPQLREHKPQIVALLQSRIEQETETAPESDALGLWLLARCAYRERAWGGVGALYLDLARWCAEQGRPVPASRRAFTAELQAEGFVLTHDGLVYGLMLREDAEACELSQAAPQASRTPQRGTARTRRIAGRRRA